MCALYYQIPEFRTQESADQWSVVGTRHQRIRALAVVLVAVFICSHSWRVLLRACWSVVPAHLLVQRALLLLCGDELPLHQAHLLLEGVHLAHGRGGCAVGARCGPVVRGEQLDSSERVSKTVVSGE